MLSDSFISTAAGIILGGLAGMGVGGGSLLMLWLTVLSNIPQQQAKLINLMFFIPCASVSLIFRYKKDHLSIRKTAPAILCGIAGAVIGNMIGQMISGKITKKLFGILFIVCGIREITYRPQKLR